MEFIGFLALVAMLVIVVQMRSRLLTLEASVSRLNALLPQASTPAISAAPVNGTQKADTPQAAPTPPVQASVQPEAERVAACR